MGHSILILDRNNIDKEIADKIDNDGWTENDNNILKLKF